MIVKSIRETHLPSAAPLKARTRVQLGVRFYIRTALSRYVIVFLSSAKNKLNYSLGGTAVDDREYQSVHRSRPRGQS